MDIELKLMTVPKKLGGMTFNASLGRSEVFVKNAAGKNERVGYVETTLPCDVSFIRPYPTEFCEAVCKTIAEKQQLPSVPKFTRPPEVVDVGEE